MGLPMSFPKNRSQLMPKRAETTEVSIGEVQTYIVLCGEGTLLDPEVVFCHRSHQRNLSVMYQRGSHGTVGKV